MNTYEFDYREDVDKYCTRKVVKAYTFDNAIDLLDCKHVVTLLLRKVTTPDEEEHSEFPFGPQYDIKV